MSYLKIVVGYDVIKKRPIINGVKSLPGEEENSVIAFLKSACGLYGLNKSIVDDQLTMIMQDNAKNPVVDFLSKASRTKNHNPIHQLIDSLPVKNKAWAKIAFYRWFIQCVAAADGAKRSGNKQALPKYESVLTFYGSQGLLKTTFIRSLLPQCLKTYLKDGILLDLNNTDSIREALSAWIVELGELDSTFKKSEISQIKAFLSRILDEIRRPYARAASITPRQTSFFASVNEERFLRDSTGNRRYLPITVNAVLIVPSDFDCTDFWAFIWQEYLNGNQWWLTKQEEEEQQKALKSHEDNSFEEMLLDEFAFHEDENYRPQLLTGNDILDAIKIRRSRANSTALGVSLKKLGIQKNSSREYMMPKTRLLQKVIS
jgi:predicted P-loop ATPase